MSALTFGLVKVFLFTVCLSKVGLSQNLYEYSKSERRLELVGRFSPSFYWVALEQNHTGPKTVKLLDIHGNTLVKVSESFFKELRMEGTGKLRNGKLINFASRIVKPDGSKEVRWRWCGPEAPYGYGFENFILKPYKSVAVDPDVIPLGSKVYIPDAKGTRLPGGKIHDGYFEAVDIGSMITDKKIDLFTAYGDRSDVFEANGMQTRKPVKVYLVR